jgi:hypothetical protein
VTQAILPALSCSGIADPGLSKSCALLRAEITDPGYNEQRQFFILDNHW